MKKNKMKRSKKTGGFLPTPVWVRERGETNSLPDCRFVGKTTSQGNGQMEPDNTPWGKGGRVTPNCKRGRKVNKVFKFIRLGERTFIGGIPHYEKEVGGNRWGEPSLVQQ